MTTNPYAPPSAVVADIPAPDATPQPPFFAVSIVKLVVLSVVTLGIYELFWFYRNWQLIKRREHSDISPAPRAIFAYFYCYQCFARIRDFEAPGVAESTLPAGLLAFGWIAMTLFRKLPGAYSLLPFVAILLFIPVQLRAAQINAVVQPEHNPNSRFTAWNWVGVVLGLFLALIAVDSILPAQR